MRFEQFSLGSIRVDGVSHEHNLVTGEKSTSRTRNRPRNLVTVLVHTPLSTKRTYPGNATGWCLVGTHTATLPVTKDVKREAKRRNVDLIVLPTAQAIQALNESSDKSVP
jgi:hypothetical protein